MSQVEAPVGFDAFLSFGPFDGYRLVHDQEGWQVYTRWGPVLGLARESQGLPTKIGWTEDGTHLCVFAVAHEWHCYQLQHGKAFTHAGPRSV